MSAYQLLLVLILVALIIVALFLHVPTRRPRARSGHLANRPRTDAAFRDDDQYWAGGFLYNNPDDPSLFVPKRFGLGWTVNLGHPRGRLLLIGMLLLPLALLIVNVLFFGTAPIGCHPSGCYPLP